MKSVRGREEFNFEKRYCAGSRDCKKILLYIYSMKAVGDFKEFHFEDSAKALRNFEERGSQGL